jgi:hypothetical protein
MRSLAERQAAFGRALLSGADPALLGEFAEPAPVAETRFAAYRRNALGNWRAALGGTYPVLAQLIGPARFRGLCEGYIAAHPSADGDLNAYGEALPACGAILVLAREFPWLPDLARLEWALQVAYGAADPVRIDLVALFAVPPERQADVRLRLWRGASLVESAFAIGAIWRAHQLDDLARDAALSTIDLMPGRHAVLASRGTGGDVEAIDLGAGEAALWRALAAGRALSDAIAAASAEDPETAAAEALPRWFAQHLIVGIE